MTDCFARRGTRLGIGYSRSKFSRNSRRKDSSPEMLTERDPWNSRAWMMTSSGEPKRCCRGIW